MLWTRYGCGFQLRIYKLLQAHRQIADDGLKAGTSTTFHARLKAGSTKGVLKTSCVVKFPWKSGLLRPRPRSPIWRFFLTITCHND
jgi:hypothetical protein